MAVMHTTMIRASMTAYSTAVGPSSRFRKLTTRCANLRIALLLGKKDTGKNSGRSHGRVQGHIAERRIGVTAQRCDGSNAHHDDQGQHDGVFHGGGAVFR